MFVLCSFPTTSNNRKIISTYFNHVQINKEREMFEWQTLSISIGYWLKKTKRTDQLQGTDYKKRTYESRFLLFWIMILPGIKWNRSTKILPTFSNTLSVPRPHFPLSNASATGHPPKLGSNTFVTPRAKLPPVENYLKFPNSENPVLVSRIKNNTMQCDKRWQNAWYL